MSSERTSDTCWRAVVVFPVARAPLIITAGNSANRSPSCISASRGVCSRRGQPSDQTTKMAHHAVPNPRRHWRQDGTPRSTNLARRPRLTVTSARFSLPGVPRTVLSRAPMDGRAGLRRRCWPGPPARWGGSGLAVQGSVDGGAADAEDVTDLRDGHILLAVQASRRLHLVG
jgi:hypothetical protein